jgi:hypothetical protein
MHAQVKALLGGAAAIALLGPAAVLTAPEADAQASQGTITTQSGYKADAAQFFVQQASGRTGCSASQDSIANLTITITPPAGNYVYLTGLYIEVAPNATASTSAVTWTSTNLTGSPVWLVNTTTAAAANPSAEFIISEQYPTGLKSTVAGTPVTILPVTTHASSFVCAHAVGYFNPS